MDLSSKLKNWVKRASLLTAFTGVVVMIGWLADISLLKGLHPSWPTMKFNTALCFFILGVTFYLCNSEAYQHKKWLPSLSIGLLSLSSFIGLYSLMENLNDMPWSISRLFFSNEDAQYSKPGLMSMLTALNFILLSIYGLFNYIETQKKLLHYVKQLLVSAVYFISIIALIGYSFHHLQDFKIEAIQSMALHTSLLFVLLSAALTLKSGFYILSELFDLDEETASVAIKSLVVAFFTPFFVGWVLRQGQVANWYNLEFELALDLLFESIILSTFIIYQLPKLSAYKLQLITAKRNLHRSNLELEKRVEQRTQDLIYKIKEVKTSKEKIAEQEKMLVHAQKMKAIAEMANGVAHEINNPLAIIQLNASKLKKFVDNDPSGVKKIDSIVKTVKRIAFIVQGLRDFSSNNNNEAYKPYSINEIAKGALDLYQEKFLEKAIAIQIEHQNEDVFVSSNPNQLSRALFNILTNAFDAISKHEQPWIKLITRKENDSELVIEIIDSGTGIPEELHEKIMMPFFTTREVGAGTGLGLSVADGIVQAHGGRIEVNKNSSHTSFLIHLPIAHLEISSQVA